MQSSPPTGIALGQRTALNALRPLRTQSTGQRELTRPKGRNGDRSGHHHGEHAVNKTPESILEAHRTAFCRSTSHGCTTLKSRVGECLTQTTSSLFHPPPPPRRDISRFISCYLPLTYWARAHEFAATLCEGSNQQRQL